MAPTGLPPFAGAVLTGGASRRMGTDKALLAVDGHPLAGVAVAALRGAGAQSVSCIGGDLAGLAAAGFDAHPDDHPGEGPLGGICTALRLAPADIVVVLSCDMPSIDAATVSALVASLADQPGADVAAPVVDGHVQAITAAYRRSARPGLVGAFEQGERAVRRALAGLSVQAIEGLDAHRLADVDRPEDLPRYARPS